MRRSVQYWRHRTESLAIQDSTDHRNANVFRAHAAPQGMGDNLMNALKWQSNEKMGDCPVRMIVPGSLEQSRRKLMDGLWLFIAVDKCAAAKIRNLQKDTRSKKIDKAKVRDRFPGRFRGGAVVLILRAHEEGGHRKLARTGTPSARPFFKESMEQSGKPCMIDTRTCTKQ